jgi:quercetin dioxygenase-like cupin family protein
LLKIVTDNKDVFMHASRLFHLADHLQPADGEPVRSVVTESADSSVVAWHVKPGQRIAPHTHPDGQDTWMILSGQGEYYPGSGVTTLRIGKGDIVIAHRGEVHGVLNTGTEPLIFLSVVSPTMAGYEKA